MDWMTENVPLAIWISAGALVWLSLVNLFMAAKINDIHWWQLYPRIWDKHARDQILYRLEDLHEIHSQIQAIRESTKYIQSHTWAIRQNAENRTYDPDNEDSK